MAKMIYSDNNDRMIHKGFTFIIMKSAGRMFTHHFTWNETDELYYNDETDEDYYSLDVAERKMVKWKLEGTGYWD